MSFAIPTIDELVDQARAEMGVRMGVGPLTPSSALEVFATVMAGLTVSAHDHLDYIRRQVLPDTADGEYLERHADLRGVRRHAARYASGTVKITGTEGSQMPTGARLQRADGRVFETEVSTTIGTSGSETVAVQAVEPGVGANSPSGTIFTLQTAYPGIESIAASVGVLEGGTNQETDDELRGRVRRAWRQRPQAGTASDYIGWALEVPGITRAWAAANTPQVGTVRVFVVADAGSPTIAPTTAQINEVEELIAQSRPVTARAQVIAPVLEPLDLTISLAPGTAEVRAAADAAIRARIALDAEVGGTLRLSRIREAISTTPGEQYHTLELPAADPVAGPGTLFVPGAIKWS